MLLSVMTVGVPLLFYTFVIVCVGVREAPPLSKLTQGPPAALPPEELDK